MQIPALLTGLPGLVGAGLKLVGIDLDASLSAQPARSDKESDDPALSGPADLHAITPREYSLLIARLHADGELGDDAFLELQAVRSQLDRVGVPEDERLDMIGFVEARLAAATSVPQDGQTQESAKRQLRLLQSLSRRGAIDASA